MSYIGNEPTSVAFLTDQFSGNGSTVAFTMSVAPATTTSILVAITGVVQDPTTYAVSGTTLTFSAAPPSGTGNISVRYMGIPASGVATTAYRTVTEFTATAGQTTFSVPSYTVGYIDVYRNGSRLGAADFTATNGTTVVLAAAATSGDLVVTESFYVSSVLNAIPATAGAVNSTYLAGGAALSNIGAGGLTQSYVGTNVGGTGPAFSAYQSPAQTLSTNVYTKLQFQVKEFDTASCFNNTGSTVGGIPAYAFLPNVAGYYQITGGLALGVTACGVIVQIYKNGSIVRYICINGAAAVQGGYGSAIVYLNGSTDYIELYALVTTGQAMSPTSPNTYFQAALVRAA